MACGWRLARHTPFMPSLMAIETVRLTVAEAWWPDLAGKLSYSLIRGPLRSAHQRCEAGLLRIDGYGA